MQTGASRPSASTTPSSGPRPRGRSEVGGPCPGRDRPGHAHIPKRQETHPMNTKVPAWLTAGCLAATGLVAVALAPGASRPAELPAPAASDFSPYVTEDGGI